eukprot:1157795-Pelagomonas_calceolata.AAC.6
MQQAACCVCMASHLAWLSRVLAPLCMDALRLAMLPCFVLTEHGGLGFGSSMHRCPTLDDASMSSQNMEDWDQAELERVVKEKHSKEKPPNATNIICKYFLEAVETKKYGWSPHTNPSPFDHGMMSAS